MTKRRAATVALLQHLRQMEPGAGFERFESPVIEQQQLGLAEPSASLRPSMHDARPASGFARRKSRNVEFLLI
ncbi:hypothetical protein [Sphingopyxis sp. DBS4]|uniref:hypothetical protein n=1 Tax=Sphingopyxis sp. DBS4 TaxID=2968500 RepID=UPI00214BBB96|nr:hypothetical protein [Sphingopyxis sp. DBS4]